MTQPTGGGSLKSTTLLSAEWFRRVTGPAGTQRVSGGFSEALAAWWLARMWQ